MHLDVGDLSAFYADHKGQLARRFIRERMREMWPSVQGQSVLGLGYATPFLRPFQAEASRVIALMPAQQGVIAWPHESKNLVALAEEGELPLPDASIDRVIMAHVLETSESVRPLLRQVWRVLSPSGRLIVLAPNRTSLWAQMERTPFGHGAPFSRAQLVRLLNDSMFTPLSVSSCLHMPPFGLRTIVRDGKRWESMGANLWPRFAGVWIAEATKQIYALMPDGGSRKRVPARVAAATAGGENATQDATEEKSHPQP